MTTLRKWMEHITQDTKALTIIEESEPRIIRAYKELLYGYTQNPQTILKIVEDVEEHQGLVIERDIFFTSFCGHHFLPFFGTIDIVYEPDTKIVGLGKLPRVARAISQRFQLQEFIVKEIAEAIMKHVQAKGVYVRATAKHLCVCGRGPISEAAETICTYAIGSLEKAGRKLEVLNNLKQ